MRALLSTTRGTSIGVMVTLARRSLSSAPSSSVRLHNFWLSSCSWRVRIALNLHRIPYEYVPVQMGKGLNVLGHLSPMKRVPVLEIDGNVLSDSIAICRYLDSRESFSNTSLEPADGSSALQRYQVAHIMQLVSSAMQPLQNAAVQADVKAIVDTERGSRESFISSRDVATALGRKYITKGLFALEAQLEQSAGWKARTGGGCFVCVVEPFVLTFFRKLLCW